MQRREIQEFILYNTIPFVFTLTATATVGE